MATKKATKKPTKTAFILSLPRDLPAAEAVRKAKAAGIKGLSETYVYKVRSKAKAGGGKKKAGRKTAAKKKGGRGSASDFVRSMPRTMSAKEVVAAAARKKIRLTEASVYQTRAYDRAKSKRGTSRPGPKKKDFKFQVFSGGGGGSEAELKRIALAVGFPRALKVVEDLGKKFESVQRQYQALLG